MSKCAIGAQLFTVRQFTQAIEDVAQTHWLKKCAGRMPDIHFKDMCITPDCEIRMAPIGEGNLDRPGLLEAANVGGTKFAFIEQDLTYDRDPFDCLALSFRYLHAMGAC